MFNIFLIIIFTLIYNLRSVKIVRQGYKFDFILSRIDIKCCIINPFI